MYDSGGLFLEEGAVHERLLAAAQKLDGRAGAEEMTPDDDYTAGGKTGPSGGRGKTQRSVLCVIL